MTSLLGDLMPRGKDEAQSRHLTLVHARGRIDFAATGTIDLAQHSLLAP